MRRLLNRFSRQFPIAHALSREVLLHSSDFDVESFLRLFLCYCADAQADPNPEISLVDESSAVREDGDAWSACRGHELLLQGGEAFSKGAVKPGKLFRLTDCTTLSHAALQRENRLRR